MNEKEDKIFIQDIDNNRIFVFGLKELKEKLGIDKLEQFNERTINFENALGKEITDLKERLESVLKEFIERYLDPYDADRDLMKKLSDK